jgi:hypothetical protein
MTNASRAARLPALLAALIAFPVAAEAHVGSADVVHQGNAGPYTLLVSIRPPDVIPGVAEIFVQAPDGGVERLSLVPMPMSGDGAKFAPTADDAKPVAGVTGGFQARLWMMAAGSWQVRITADGPKGTGELRVPVPALPLRTQSMQRGLGALLLVLGLLLAVGVVSIVGASVREGQLDPGRTPDPPRLRSARTGMIGAAVVVALAVWGGNAWWTADANASRGYVYKPIALEASVDGAQLDLTLRDPGWLKARRLDDLVPDHDHLMHLFAVRTPALDRVLHLHPEQIEAAKFRSPLPAELEPGQWTLFGDVVHESGLPETAVTTLTVGAHANSPLGPDDGVGAAPPVGSAGREAPLASGGKVVRLGDDPRADGKPAWMRFRVLDADGAPSKTMELYMGMLGHAAVMRDDLTVFAHLHPSGSVPMASLMIAGDHSHMHDAPASLPSEIGFPWVYPRAGRYRVFVQFKRAGKIETAAFDFDVAG